MQLQVGLQLFALLLATTASCGRQTSPHVQVLNDEPSVRNSLQPARYVRRQKTSVPTGSKLPSPCDNDQFQVPVYVLTNVSASKAYHFQWYDEQAEWQLNFTLRDTANNYALRCIWGPFGHLYKQDWKDFECSPEDASITPPGLFQTQNILKVETFQREMAQYPNGPVSIVQQWYCPSKNASYPLLYQASADPGLLLEAHCPANVTDDGIKHACNVTTPLPAAVTAKWRPPTRPTGKAELIPRPDSPYVSQGGLNPPPAEDCSDMSLTHPDWTVEDAVYTTGNLKFSLTSRATKVRAVCQTDISNSTAAALKLSCSQPGGGFTEDQYRSQPVFTVEYKTDNKSLSIRHDWVCGDTGGKYKTEFRASKTIPLPLICTDDNVCQLKSLTVQGELLRPLKFTPLFFPAPPGADTKGCTSNSAKQPAWTISKFLFKETSSVFMYKERKPDTPEVTRSLDLTIQNQANLFTQSCTIYNYQLNNDSSWAKCQTNYPIEGKREIDTWVRMNLAEETFSISQTWYCNDTVTPMQFTATGSIKPPFCGWHNTTGDNEPYCTSQTSCQEILNTHWCAFTNRLDDIPSSGPLPLPVPTINGTVSQSLPLPQHELSDPDPKPNTWSCTTSSVAKPVVWRLVPGPDGAPFVTTHGHEEADAQDTRVGITVSLDNSAISSRPPSGNIFPLNGIGWWDHRLAPYTPWFEPSVTYRYVQQAGYYKDVVDWTVRFDPSNGYLELNHSWECVDKTPQWRTVFTGSWNGFVGMNCSFPTVVASQRGHTQSGIVCHLPAAGFTVMPKVWVESGKAGKPDPA
ncbi:hypothetical protein B0H63DRAFT_519079 [Podospora didyma]|uniref:AA1-like domain-containing protein n=1 Tax=Podospora didyma TaxID=330526 RepID=A0AAE0U430_9PEZI|nr:hypothetical protein B0H63DRAFT_519079 [Podospora didyma]